MLGYVKKSGVLYIVATPIGNLEDITLRALTILQKVDHIAAEDTRHSQKLLAHYQIKKPLIALHEFNEAERNNLLLRYLTAGENIALISDAGTPLISDPGYRLVKIAQEEGIKVSPIPGACAAVAALSVSGLPTDRFNFEGFLPAKAPSRRARLKQLKDIAVTLIFYEAPHRLIAAVNDMLEVFGDKRQTVIAKELTKQFETVYSGTLVEAQAWLNEDLNRQKGEFVILIHGAETAKSQIISPEALEILTALKHELPLKLAVKLTAEITKINKNLIYQAALAAK
jgi:16S rRNA (cytidine1402-2'-O)-methyltransferase